MATYKLDFLKELDKAIKGNAHFFICEKAYRLDEPTPNSIRINMGGPGRRPHESCWNFVLEALLNHKFGIRYLECNGSWNDYSSGDHIEDMQFIICCKPLLTPISMDEFKEVGIKFARKNKAPGIIFNDYERKIIQLIRFDSKQILEIPHDKYSFIKHLGYLYNFNADTLYNYMGPKEYNSDWGYPWIVGHHIRPDEEFFEFENQGLYKLR